MLTRESVVDDDNVGSLLGVGLGHIAPRQRRDSHRLEVMWRNDAILGDGLRLLRYRRASFNGEVVVRNASCDGEVRNCADGPDARRGRSSFPKLCIKLSDALILPIFVGEKRHTQ